MALLWASNQTHPDMSFNLSELNSSVSYATVEHILRSNKVLKNAKIKCHQCKLVVYSDASDNNLENSG